MPDLKVNWEAETKRISFCLKLEDATPETPSTPIERSSDYLRLSIYENKDVIYGAFPHFDESILVFEGVPKVKFEYALQIYFIKDTIVILKLNRFFFHFFHFWT